MQTVFASTYAANLRPHDRPRLDSYDSGEEFSMDHWIEVCKAVDEPDTPLSNEGLFSPQEIEEALEQIHVRNEARRRISELRP